MGTEVGIGIIVAVSSALVVALLTRVSRSVAASRHRESATAWTAARQVLSMPRGARSEFLREGSEPSLFPYFTNVGEQNAKTFHVLATHGCRVRLMEMDEATQYGFRFVPVVAAIAPGEHVFPVIWLSFEPRENGARVLAVSDPYVDFAWKDDRWRAMRFEPVGSPGGLQRPRVLTKREIRQIRLEQVRVQR